jgi:hypothetical protein
MVCPHEVIEHHRCRQASTREGFGMTLIRCAVEDTLQGTVNLA